MQLSDSNKVNPSIDITPWSCECTTSQDSCTRSVLQGGKIPLKQISSVSSKMQDLNLLHFAKPARPRARTVEEKNGSYISLGFENVERRKEFNSKVREVLDERSRNRVASDRLRDSMQRVADQPSNPRMSVYPQATSPGTSRFSDGPPALDTISRVSSFHEI